MLVTARFQSVAIETWRHPARAAALHDMFRAAMLFALSTGHKIGLAGTGAAFIIFALVSAMVIPRYSPGFPGKHLRLFLVVCVLFFVAMISAVMVWGKEKKVAVEVRQTASPAPSTPAPSGDPAAGKVVFNAQGCAACHTFTPAGAKGTVGPDLDKLAESAATAKQPLAAFTRQSIVDPEAYIAPGYPKGVMPATFGTTLTKKQIDDLVAFLDQGP